MRCDITTGWNWLEEANVSNKFNGRDPVSTCISHQLPNKYESDVRPDLWPRHRPKVA